ncbi:MAG TPA: ATP-NAD kinase family protein [Synergistaceae bacterium]|nr:ATP-NAD kinase family protein [Synergistaceae bacterium]HPJ24843.1 ATP-NAD kinase family protein [Synergistaceae bacterium]HPQ36466.1 ATP-NAD kinase family protein [Synergistaceae bacterium]
MKLGVIVNPVAGMGGAVGLKGTDGAQVLAEARRRGAIPRSPERAVRALRKLRPLRENLDVFTCPGTMGETELRECGFVPKVLDCGASGDSESSFSREHTLRGVRLMKEFGVDLLLFAGGDGTARDICEVAGESLLVLGIPAGVKIHSPVYATSPESAGELALSYLSGSRIPEKIAEVRDIDEEAFRLGRVQARLYGYLRIPFERRRVQGLKSGSPASDWVAQQAIAAAVAEEMEPGVCYVLGPGTTTREVADALGVPKTLLGVDVVRDGNLLGKDLGAEELEDLVKENPVRVVVTPIGGQGYILGRGNQQIGPNILRRCGRKGLLVLCAPEKLRALEGEPLRVDTGDPDLDREFEGYVRVRTGYSQESMYPLRGW